MSSFVLSRSALWRSDFTQKIGALAFREITNLGSNRCQKPYMQCLSLNFLARHKAKFPQRCVQYPDYARQFGHFLHLKGQKQFHVTLLALKTGNQTRYFSTSSPSCICRSVYLSSSKTSSNTSTEVKELQSMQSSPLRQRYIYVQTSTSRWEDIPGGVLFDVAYLDSAPGDKINPAVPLVVSLHTTPGSFYDLQPILEACVKAGCRVLAPAFPGQT